MMTSKMSNRPGIIEESLLYVLYYTYWYPLHHNQTTNGLRKSMHGMGDEGHFTAQGSR